MGSGVGVVTLSTGCLTNTESAADTIHEANMRLASASLKYDQISDGLY
jgi:hypothetical protein